MNIKEKVKKKTPQMSIDILSIETLEESTDFLFSFIQT